MGDLSCNTRSDINHKMPSNQRAEHADERSSCGIYTAYDDFSFMFLVNVSYAAEVFSSLRELNTGLEYIKKSLQIGFSKLLEGCFHTLMALTDPAEGYVQDGFTFNNAFLWIGSLNFEICSKTLMRILSIVPHFHHILKTFLLLGVLATALEYTLAV